jgi:hypothetical protein
MALTIPVADTWLYGRLAGDAALMALVDGPHADQLPDGFAFAKPGLVFQFQAGAELLGGGAVPIWSDLLYLVKAIGLGGSLAPLRAPLDAVDALLHRASGTVAGGGTIVACVREAPVRYPEDRNGVRYLHYGATYRIYAQA